MHGSRLLSAIASGLLLVVASCESSGPDRRQVDVSFSSQSPSASLVGGSSADITVTIGSNSLVITRAQLVLRDIKLKPTTETCADDESDDDCETIHVGPTLVDLPLTETAATELTASVPVGTYRRVQLKIHKPSDDGDDAAFVAANPDFEDISIRVEGTYNGEAFVYTSALTENIELEFSPPLVIDTDGQNFTVQVDLSSWFRSGTGVIDPRTANDGGANEQTVRDNIRASLRALEDADRNGR
jgi:hypothetical protein